MCFGYNKNIGIFGSAQIHKESFSLYTRVVLMLFMLRINLNSHCILQRVRVIHPNFMLSKLNSNKFAICNRIMICMRRKMQRFLLMLLLLSVCVSSRRNFGMMLSGPLWARQFHFDCNCLCIEHDGK